jgi:hypothetical protein
VGANAFATPAFEALTGLRWRRPPGAPAGVHEFCHAATGFAFRLARATPDSEPEEDEEEGDPLFDMCYEPVNAEAAGVAAALPPALREGFAFERARMPLLLGRLLCVLGAAA